MRMQTAFRKAPPTLILRHQSIEHIIDRLTGLTGQWDLGSRLQQGNKLVQSLMPYVLFRNG